jgi:hydrogenase small subunit
MSHLVQRFALAACAVLLGACATPPTEPVASAPAPVPELKPGRLIGYLPIAERIDSKAVLPPPPANPAEAATDEALNRAVLRLRDTARWKLAISDADVNFPHAAGVFSCAVGAPITQKETPYLYGDLLRGDAPPGHFAPQLLKYCSLTATSLGWRPFVPQIAHAMETKPRTPVLWLHGLECTCCSRVVHPLGAPAGQGRGAVDDLARLRRHPDGRRRPPGRGDLEEVMTKYKGNYILAVEGNPPLNEDGMFCIQSGKPFIEKLKHVAKDAKAIIAWGSCASWGCVQAAKPNPTQATPIHKVITDKPIIKVPGCPPIAEVMTGVITYMLTFDKIPELDRQGRPKMFYSQRIHDKCYRRPHFDAGQFVEAWDDESARKGYCLYKVGCKGPTTYNACSTVRGTRAPASRSRPATAASAAGRRLLGQGLVLRPPDHITSSASKATPTRSAARLPPWWVPPWWRMPPCRPSAAPPSQRQKATKA